MVVHHCNPNTEEAEEEGLQVQGHFEQHSETLFQKTKNAILLIQLSSLLFFCSQIFSVREAALDIHSDIKSIPHQSLVKVCR
jgi:hypothetical protein